MPFSPLAGKKQHTLSTGQASDSTAHYENIISTREQIREVLCTVSHQFHQPNWVHKVHVFVQVT